MFLRSLLAYALLFYIAVGFEFQCGHQPPDPSSITRNVPIGLPPPRDVRVNVRPADWQPLRIHIHYDSTIENLDMQSREFLKGVIQKAVEYWSSALKVRRLTEPIRLGRKCEYGWKTRGREVCHRECDVSTCNGVAIPEHHLRPCERCMHDANGNQRNETCFVNDLPWSESNLASELEKTSGVKADYILYAMAAKCGKENVAGDASACQQEATWDRPIAGRIRLCAPFDKDDANNVMKIIRHEILHALGFSKGLFPYFYREDGTPYTERDDYNKLKKGAVSPVVRTVIRDDWLTRSGKLNFSVDMISTPRVVKEARDVTVLPGRVSRITLALLEDSGWYRADYSKAEPLLWGKGLGCEFAQKSAAEWIASRRAAGKQPTPLCDARDMRARCTFHRETLCACNVVDLSAYDVVLPPEHQYFSHIKGVADGDVGKYGGRYQMMDWTPFVKETSIPDDACTVSGTSKSSDCLMEFSPSSRCIDFADDWWVMENMEKWKTTTAGGCYKTVCFADSLHIEVAGKTHICGKNDEGKRIAIREAVGSVIYSGSLLCPAYSEICTNASYPVEPPPPPPSTIPLHPPPTQAPPLASTIPRIEVNYVTFLSTLLIVVLVVVVCTRRLMSRSSPPSNLSSQA